MSEFPRSERLLNDVAWRMFAVKVARRTFVWFVVLASLYAALLLTARLSGLIPDLFAPQTLWWIPLGSLIGALATTRKPRPDEAARCTDLSQKTHDLFLTLTMLDNSIGEYKPLVGRDAEQRAGKLRGTTVLPFVWDRPAVIRGAIMPAALGLLALGIVLLPSLDPFAVQAAAKEKEQAAQKVAESKKQTETRKTELKKQKDLEDENSEEVAQALERLKADFKKMKKTEKLPNSERLAVNQKSLGEKWRKLNQQQLKDLMNGEELDQRFGGETAEEMRQWQKELQQGSSEKLKEAIAALKEDLKQLAKTNDPVERSELARKIEKQLKEMSDFATKEAGSQPLAAALQRAKDQLQTMEKADSEKLQKEAMDALQESLDLSQMEAENLAQAARDMKSLEQALQLISMSKKLNSEEQLDAEGTEECQSLSDYAELYQQMMAGMQPGPGGGDEGFGEGGEAPEDDSVKTDFVDETSKSAVQKGKVLLSMKTKGMSDTGEAKKEYRSAIDGIKQGVAEAIEQEQIPPGYIETIQKYFDKIETVEEPAGDAGAEPAAEPAAAGDAAAPAAGQ
ncbi:MAG: hypothetical protein U0992_11515 [Planctomycetaceae bacterium]